MRFARSPVTATAGAADQCGRNSVTASASSTYPIVMTPRISVTQECPAAPVAPGALLTFSGMVSNGGNVTLTNVVVVNDHSGTVPVFTADTLAPGQVANFTGSYTVPTNGACSVTSKVTVTAKVSCSGAVIESPAPVIGTVHLANGMVKVSWTATAGVTYCLLSKSSLKDSNWTTVPGNVIASGTTAFKEDLIGQGTQRLYRVMVLQE